MRLYNIAAVPVLAATLVMAQLSSCQQQATVAYADVLKATEAACQFAPVLDTVTAILAAGVPGLTTADAIAHWICNNLPATPPASLKAGTVGDAQVAVVSVNGKLIAIVGHYVAATH